jgi:TolA-binding protein
LGDILYSKTEQYTLAVLHYKKLLELKPEAHEVPEFTYRIAKSYFFLMQFDEAISAFKEVTERYKTSPLAEKAMYEIGVSYFTRGGHQSSTPSATMPAAEAYQESMDAFNRFIKRYPMSVYVPEARFGIASCLEELDQLDAAYHQYEAIKSTYPSPQVIEIKLRRIRERRAQKSR